MLGFIYNDASAACVLLTDHRRYFQNPIREQSERALDLFMRLRRRNGDRPMFVTASSVSLLKWFMHRTAGFDFGSAIYAVSDRPDVLTTYPAIKIVDAERAPIMWNGTVVEAWKALPKVDRAVAEQVIPGVDLRPGGAPAVVVPVLWDPTVAPTVPPQWLTPAMLESGAIGQQHLIPMDAGAVAPTSEAAESRLIPPDTKVVPPAEIVLDNSQKLVSPVKVVPVRVLAPAVSEADEGSSTSEPDKTPTRRVFMDTNDIAAAMGVCTKTVRQWAVSGLAHIRVGSKYRFKLEDVERFLGQQKVAQRSTLDPGAISDRIMRGLSK